MSALFQETLYTKTEPLGYGQQFLMDRVLVHEKDALQDLLIFEHPFFGRVLALDGAVQTTTKDEAFYHEMMAHVPLFAHPDPRRVLIIGGGDGGVLREVLKHPSVTEAVLVEIDPRVVPQCRKWLPSLSDGAFDHPKSRLVTDDGARFVRKAEGSFDVIIVDSTDPLGPAAPLFTESFYRQCGRLVGAEGILVTQAGVPFFQAAALRHSAAALTKAFGRADFYATVVPSYVGGMMTLGFASQARYTDESSWQRIARRFEKVAAAPLTYYHPDMHRAAFSLPAFIVQALAGAD